MIEQFFIALCGVTSVYLSQDERYAYRRWACIAGLISQPFWLAAAWKADQYGIMFLAFVYAIGWMRGINTYWMKPSAND